MCNNSVKNAQNYVKNNRVRKGLVLKTKRPFFES
mgnify:CR=1 FL=1